MSQAHDIKFDKLGAHYCSKCNEGLDFDSPCPYESAEEIKAKAEVQFMKERLKESVMTSRLGFAFLAIFLIIIFFGLERVSSVLVEIKNMLMSEFALLVVACNEAGWLEPFRHFFRFRSGKVLSDD